MSNDRMQNLVIFIATSIVGAVMVVILSLQKALPTHNSSEILQFKSNTDRLIKEFKTGIFKNSAYEQVAYIADTFGPRQLGSQALEDAQAYIAEMMKKDGFEDVTLEPVHNVTHWVRNEESLYLVTPRRAKIAMLGLGTSVGTPAQGITAEVIVVTSFEELDKVANDAKGKIVLFNQPWTSYGEVSKYRYGAASAAAKHGAVAALVRTLASFSIRSPHTGSMGYSDQIKIPAAAVSVEDAEMMARMIKRGQPVTVTLKMSCENLPPTTSHNVYGDFKGSKYPNEIILLGGHSDSWDVGTGAMDDLGGIMVNYEAVRAMIKLGMRPLRTLRVIGWTGEELGSKGATVYNQNHKDQLIDHILALESDGGTDTPYGLQLATKSEKTKQTMEQILTLLCGDLNTTLLTTSVCYGVGQDTQSMCLEADIPSAEPETDRTKYFYYHHSEGDMPLALNSEEMDKNAAMIAVVAYSVANLAEKLPKQ